ncbi:hypothetical protein TREMEDRAFT_63299 [Tremella mesenterica DSM 1558]|uniref:uncharacterized protein n=1 Tax=Tremella mesenterica (strain ATCC 24925 / CBS 8224 / DSM 1558 / NBRC 9311 / NRRL Y-6157 / RJB 2259-6 / UBC 559-6) TaxID=578456 RepID=UPI0003F491BB|nr:uncharacterized protein TREMEDRAFT_63299 [Tremella mesenterica DSM 1558]EIW68834.1 hypothetical protein TREMEDRAFT_63299 [Tremella mesenterica DSM 1558]
MDIYSTDAILEFPDAEHSPRSTILHLRESGLQPQESPCHPTDLLWEPSLIITDASSFRVRVGAPWPLRPSTVIPGPLASLPTKLDILVMMQTTVLSENPTDIVRSNVTTLYEDTDRFPSAELVVMSKTDPSLERIFDSYQPEDSYIEAAVVGPGDPEPRVLISLGNPVDLLREFVNLILSSHLQIAARVNDPTDSSYAIVVKASEGSAVSHCSKFSTEYMSVEEFRTTYPAS